VLFSAFYLVPDVVYSTLERIEERQEQEGCATVAGGTRPKTTLLKRYGTLESLAADAFSPSIIAYTYPYPE
jgi:hypothetical protein